MDERESNSACVYARKHLDTVWNGQVIEKRLSQTDVCDLCVALCVLLVF